MLETVPLDQGGASSSSKLEPTLEIAQQDVINNSAQYVQMFDLYNTLATREYGSSSMTDTFAINYTGDSNQLYIAPSDTSYRLLNSTGGYVVGTYDYLYAQLVKNSSNSYSLEVHYTVPTTSDYPLAHDLFFFVVSPETVNYASATLAIWARIYDDD